MTAQPDAYARPPAEWDEATRERAARELAHSKTTAQLRRFQDLNRRQTASAHKIEGPDPCMLDRRRRALDNLDTMADIYSRAVMLREFPEMRRTSQ